MGSVSSALDIVKMDKIGETKLAINGEIIDMEKKKEVKAKLTKIYQRGCMSLNTPKNVSIRRILVNQNYEN
jgi:hypothetical protein